MFSLEYKKMFITGGASGIGLAVATHFKNNGADVAIADIHDGDGAVDRIGAKFFKTDVSNEQMVMDALADAETALGKLDIVINNAGIPGEATPIEEKTGDELKRVFDINLNGVFYGIKHAPKHMKNGGSIINTASLAGLIVFPTYSVYSATKAAIVNLTKTAAIELGSKGIRVNAICPGTVMTPMQPEDDPEALLCKALTPLCRWATTDDLVGIYQFLAVDASRYMTGQALCIDGGWSAGISMGLLDNFFGEAAE